MSRPKIYEQHDKAFSNVSAYVLMHSGERLGTIAIKYPADGAGRLYMYLHIHSLRMVRGMASGYGYDKASAAFENAAKELQAVKLEQWQDNSKGDYDSFFAHVATIADVADNIGGRDWRDALRDAGYVTLQAV